MKVISKKYNQPSIINSKLVNTLFWLNQDTIIITAYTTIK